MGLGLCLELWVSELTADEMLRGEFSNLREAIGLSTRCFMSRNGLYSPPQVDRIWGIWKSYTPKAISYLLKADYNPPFIPKDVAPSKLLFLA